MRTVQSTFTTAQYQALIYGLQKYCANSTFVVGSENLTTPQVVAFITAILNAALAVPPAKAAWLATVAARDAIVEQNGETIKEVRNLVGIQFKNAPTTLADFAIAPRKAPKPLSGEARTAASAKAKATRIARGTTSPKQKASITGNVTGVTILPVENGTIEGETRRFVDRADRARDDSMRDSPQVAQVGHTSQGSVTSETSQGCPFGFGDELGVGHLGAYPSGNRPTDPVEAALVRALDAATAAGQWSAVVALAGQLDARRLARVNVIPLDARRRGRS